MEEISTNLENEYGLAKDQFRLTGLAVLYNNMLQSLFDSQIGTIVIVFTIIFLMFLILFRSFYLSIIGIIPNLLAASVVLGTMGLFGIPLDIMTITVAAISVGMAVDNTIHYIHRFKKEFANSGNYKNSMHNSHRTIGRAMFYTSLTIILGFLVFATSNFNPSVYFGFVSLAMVMALLGALTLLPQLILYLSHWGKKKLQEIDMGLKGLKIVEMAGIGPGPFCGMILADLGAEVIRVDRASAAGTGSREEPANRGKKSIAVDLKSPRALRLF